MDLYVNVHVFHRSQDVELQNQTPLCYVTWNIYSVTFLVPSVHFLLIGCFYLFLNLFHTVTEPLQ